jgi:TetR/AcrR family transcriptional regulator, regulator of biofilm formation and stress response
MSTPRVPRQARGEERRELILRTTLRIIGRDGIAAVTHRLVAEEADVPLGSLTYWFATKDDLLREALRLFVEDETARLRRVGEQIEEGMSPVEIAERFGAVLETGGDTEQVAQFELYLEAARNPALREVAQQCFAAYDEISRVALRAAGVEDDTILPALFVAEASASSIRRPNPDASWRTSGSNPGPESRTSMRAKSGVSRAATTRRSSGVSPL